MNGGSRSVARHIIPDIKSDEYIIKIKMVVLNTVTNNVKTNYWDRGKERSNPEGVVSIRDNCQGHLTKKQKKFHNRYHRAR